MPYVPEMAAVAQRLTATFGASADLVVHRFQLVGGQTGLVCYLDNLVDVTVVDRDILQPLMRGVRAVDALPVGQTSTSTDWDTITAAVTQGQTVVCLPDAPEAWIVDTAKIPHRSIGRPETEMAVRGPQEAFTEVLGLQLSQVRHRLRSPHLIFEQLMIGTRYPHAVAIAYLADVVNPALADAVRERLRRIQA